MKFAASLVLLSLCASSSFAQTPAAARQGEGLRYFIGVDLNGGGETLAHALFTSGDSQSIKAGGGPQVKGGIEYRFSARSAVRASFGYEWDNSSGTNGEMMFSRRPAEVMGLWNVSENWRLGAGIRYVSGAKFTSSGVASYLGRFELKSSPGPVLEAEYLYGPWYTSHLGFTFRMVGDRYTYESYKVNGKHFAIGANYYF